MTSDADLRKVLRMLGQAVYSWGIHSLDDDATDEREILDNLSTEARMVAERDLFGGMCLETTSHGTSPKM